MNWFSKHAQTGATLDDEMSLKGTPEHYQQVAHMYHAGNEDKYHPDDECEEYMWVWKNGQIEIEEVIGQEIHEGTWGEVEMFDAWSGRYNTCQDVISISGPFLKNSGFEKTPHYLASKLKSMFSGSAKIIWYHDELNGLNRSMVASCGSTCKIG